MNIVLISAVLPVAILLLFIYRKDKYNKEPISKLLLTFFVGCLSVIPASLQESLLIPLAPVEPVANGLFTGFVVAGFSEELWKLLLLYLVIWHSPYFDEYFDGIIYAAYLSLGFACIENIMYVFRGTDPMTTAMMRGLLAVPAHFLFAVIMGYYFSLAKFDLSHKGVHLLKAFLYPMLLHGTYDSLLMVSQGLGNKEPIATSTLFLLFIIFDVMMWRWGLRRIKRLQQHSREQNFNRLRPFDNFKWDV